LQSSHYEATANLGHDPLGYRGYKEKAFSQEVRLLACSLKTISA